MNIPKIVIAVAGLHVVAFGLLLFQPGCQSNRPSPRDTEPEIVKSSVGDNQSPKVSDKRNSSPSTSSQGQSDGAVDSSFNAGFDSENKKADSSPKQARTDSGTEPNMSWEDVDSLEGSYSAMDERESITKPSPSDQQNPSASTTADVSDSAVVRGSGDTYTVQDGDSLWKISRKHDVSLDALLGLNKMSRNSVIHPGDKLELPSGASRSTTQVDAATQSSNDDANATSTYDGETREYYLIEGDTLSSIARDYGVSVRALKEYNNISDPRSMRAGQKIMIPTDNQASSARQTGATSSRGATRGNQNGAGGGQYRVQKGDNLGKIARQFDIGVRELMDMNGINDPRKLRAGQVIRVNSEQAQSDQRTSNGNAQGGQNQEEEDPFGSMGDIPVIEVQEE